MRSCIHFWIVDVHTHIECWSRKDTKQSVNQLTKCISRTRTDTPTSACECVYTIHTHAKSPNSSIHTQHTVTRSLARSLRHYMACYVGCYTHMRWYTSIYSQRVQCRALARWQKKGMHKTAAPNYTYIYSKYSVAIRLYNEKQRNFIDLIRMQCRRCTRALSIVLLPFFL